MALEVDRLRADIAVIERRLERAEKTAALSSEMASSLRRRMDEAASGAGGGESGGGRGGAAAAASGAMKIPDEVLADVAGAKDEARAARKELQALGERAGRIEDAQRSAAVALQRVDAAIAALQRDIAAVQTQVAAGLAARRDDTDRQTITAGVAAVAGGPHGAGVSAGAPAPSPAPSADGPTSARPPAVAPPTGRPSPSRSTLQPQPASVAQAAPAATPLPYDDRAAAGPAAEDDADSEPDADTDMPEMATLPHIAMPSPPMRRVDRRPLENARWDGDEILVDRPIALLCDAPGHPDGALVEVEVLDAAGSRVAALDGEVSDQQIRVVWRYRYEDDPATDKRQPELCFVVRASNLEDESGFVPIRDFSPPPKRRGFSDLLRGKK
ncbi:MAG TPA: hypothetical protein VG389_25905 [Myxococcota bacterium]|jgi:hypothetical protein|nr:hypothetical protein [Myxococcota bacterium]